MDQQQAQELARILHVSGGVLGALCGCFGGLIGFLAPRGKGRPIVIGGMYVFAGIGAASLLTGLVLAIRGVPFVVCWPLILIGVILPSVMLPMLHVVRQRYREAEVRRLEAAALRGS